jgi:Asp-tRNA(Asn)/Glu-tRNA(Gln) amidotransferase C subunit
MKKSYVNESSLVVNVQIDLGEVNQLIDTLKEIDTEGSNNYRVKDLLNKLNTLRRDAAEEAKREFETMLERS